MIRLSIGNVGSGKTACEVREMALNLGKMNYYSNIQTSLPYQTDINSQMICCKSIVGERPRLKIPIYDYKINTEFWKKAKKPLSVVIDEAHTIINSRKAMSKVNIIVTDWIALIRRILGEDSRGSGDLVLITQLPNRVDVISREMATQVKHHLCRYKKRCLTCGFCWKEHSDMPEKLNHCPQCMGIDLRKYDFRIEIKCYASMEDYTMMKIWGEKTHYRHYVVRDIEKYFGLYDTLQWDNMFTDLYQ